MENFTALPPKILGIFKILDKIPTWQVRAKEFKKVKAVLESLRDPVCSLADWRVKYKLFHSIANWFTLGQKQALYPSPTPEVVQSMRNHFDSNSNNSALPIVITMTSCKRLDLLSRTINSMLVNILDITQFVREWIVVDDNSTEIERFQMKRMYPFITFIDKSIENKGHPKSMNVILDGAITCVEPNEAEYSFIFHVEDDWEWWYPDTYLAKCLAVFEHAPPAVAQVLLNFEYSEDLLTAQNIWNRDMHYTTPSSNTPQIRYFIHEYFKDPAECEREQRNCGGTTSMYWPHFSFRVGLTKVEALRKVGQFHTSCAHFELEYAHRYVAQGFLTATLDCCYCTHIGRRTYEQHDKTKMNAYALNEEKQFEATPAISSPVSGGETRESIIRLRTYVINLERRPERLLEFVKTNNQELLSYEVVCGVDGKHLKPDIKVQKIFETGDYNFRRGIVGCGYSHLKVWSRFLESGADYAIVLEDDCTLSYRFNDKILHLLNAYSGDFDLMFMYWNPYDPVANANKVVQFAKPTAQLWTVEESFKKSMGSAVAYLLTPKAAKHLLEWVNKFGMPNAVDTNMMNQPGLRIMYSNPMLAFATSVQENAATASDIQFDFDCSVQFTNEEEFLQAEIKRWSDKGVAVHFCDGDGDWLTLVRQPFLKVIVSLKSLEVPRYLHVKWYLVGKYKIVVPDVYITSEVYLSLPWFNNRINMHKV